MQVVPLGFQDGDFAHRFESRNVGGMVERRWVAYGMPRFRPELALTAFYLYGRDPKDGQIKGPVGTGVFVLRDSEVPGCIPHSYAVTASHVVRDGGSILRFNTMRWNPPGAATKATLTSRVIEAEPHEWRWIVGGDDIAALDVTDITGHRDDLIRAADEKDFVTREFIRRVKLDIGEDAFMLGMFAGNPGQRVNVPAARFGNISQIAGVNDPVPQRNKIKRPSHIFDMHSRPGFSGSPVFVYRTPGNDLTAIDEDEGFTLDLMREDNAFIKLLGIHSGQFQDEVSGLTIPSSMTVVVPAWAITELLDLPEFEAQRKMREKQAVESGSAMVHPESISYADALAETPTAPDAAEESGHQERFTRLVSVASRKKPQAD